MPDKHQAKRWRDFQRRVTYAPENVYYHRTHGWAYIPVHPFGDEEEVLAKLGMQPTDCQIADAWWGIAGDATLLQSCIVGIVAGLPRLIARASPHQNRSVHLTVVFEAAYVTRTLFEAAMVQFAEAGFPHAAVFQLRWGDQPWECLA